MSNKEKYRLLCYKEKSIPIFCQDWWLDLVCGDSWDVCLVENEHEILGSMPFFKLKSYGFNYLVMPQLTQYLGPWIKISQSNYYKLITHQKKIMTALIEQLPKYDNFLQNWHYTQTNYLPFYWKGFRALINYTYVIDELKSLDTIWKRFSDNTKNEINKAKKKTF